MISASESTTEGTGVSLRSAAGRLITVSEERSTDTFHRIDFPASLGTNHPAIPGELISLRGHPAYAELGLDARWRLGLLETVNFFSLNIHGEQALVQELGERLYRKRWEGETDEVSRYLQHFIHEENSHTYMLAEFCSRYYGRVMPEIIFEFERPELSRLGTDLLFYGRTHVLENFLDYANRVAMRDPELEPTVRAIHRSHHLEESRHIAFGRVMLVTLLREMKAKKLDVEIGMVSGLLRQYADFAFSRLVNPRVYREIGLSQPLKLVEEVRSTPHWIALTQRWTHHTWRFAAKLGL